MIKILLCIISSIILFNCMMMAADEAPPPGFPQDPPLPRVESILPLDTPGGVNLELLRSTSLKEESCAPEYGESENEESRFRR